MNTKLKTEQNRTEQNRTEQNNYLYSIAKGMAMVVLCVALINGCSKKASPSSSSHVALINTVLTNDEKMSILMKSEASHRVPIHEAQQAAFAFLGKISPASTTAENMVMGVLGNKATVVARVKTFWQVHTVHTTSTPANARSVRATASTTTDTVTIDSIPIYTFNFENSDGSKAGFAITAGDDRLPTVLACSDNGSLGDTITNPGIAIFMGLLPMYIDSTIAQKNRLYDSLYKIALAKLNALNKPSDTTTVKGRVPDTEECQPFTIITYDKTTTTYTGESGPFLKTEWGQWSPYNDRINDKHGICDGHNAPAGCVATAVAQIMAYHRHPKSFTYLVRISTETYARANWPFDWDSILSKSSASDLSPIYKVQVANLFGIIGDEVGMKFACSASGADEQGAINCYNSLGYTSDGAQDYNLNKIINSLSNRRPVEVGGYRYAWWLFKWWPGGEGHEWVIDGYKKQIQKRDLRYTIRMCKGNGGFFSNDYEQSTENTTDYVHCNWGWGHRYQQEQRGGGEGYYVSGVFNPDDQSYKAFLKIITNIRPK